MKFTVVAILACAMASSAFSLEKTSSRQMRSASRFPQAIQQRSSSFKLSSAPADIGEGSEGEIVAAAKAAKAATAAPKTLLDKLWNPNTQLAAYMAVWYLGNIYYNIYNKKACANIHAHWSVAFAQLVVSAHAYMILA